MPSFSGAAWTPLRPAHAEAPDCGTSPRSPSACPQWAAVTYGFANIAAGSNLFGVLEFNIVSTVDEADRTPVNFEGFDLVNFGATESGTVFTWGFGARWLPMDHVQIGFAYEIPMSGRGDIIDKRFNVDFVLCM